MARKLISLEGATVVVPSGWTASAGFYTTGYISQNGPGAIINDTEAYGIAIGYAVFYDEGGTELQADSNNLTTMSAGGMWGQMVHYHNETLTITNIANGLETNETFIQWLLDNNAEITGGVYEAITQLAPFLTNIANAIRTKKGTTETINAQNFASEIESIESGGGNWTEEPRYSGQIIMENVGYASGKVWYYSYENGLLNQITLTLNGTTDVPSTNFVYINVYGGVLTEIVNTSNVEILDNKSDGNTIKLILQPKAESWSISLWTED